jgi:hypothetical protein
VWAALDKADLPGCYARLVRFILLSARRAKEPAKALRWERLDGDVWILPAAEHKTGEEAGDMAVPITSAMLAQMGERRKRGLVFPGPEDAAKPFARWSAGKKALDEAIAELREAEGRDPMPAWQLRDLRRTARTLMSRAGVPSDHAELALGHAIPGVEGVYDRYAYLEERRDALERLARLVERILAGEVTGNVIRPAAFA